MSERPVPEMSRPHAAESIGVSPQGFRFEASADERRALARRFGLRSVDRLIASGRLRRVENTVILLEASFEADVVQSCVVSLEPVAQQMAESFTMRFASRTEDESGELDLDPLAEDPPDPIVEGIIDVGEAVAEHVALALDPYPRAPDAELPEIGQEDEGARHPFAVLRTLRDGT